MKRKRRYARFERATYSVTEASEILGISRNTAYAAVRGGSLPAVKIAGVLKVTRLTIDRLLGRDAAA